MDKLKQGFADISHAKRNLASSQIGIQHSLSAQIIPRVTNRESFPLSFAQQRLWFPDRFGEGGARSLSHSSASRLHWRQEGELEARRAMGMVDTFRIEWISCETEILDWAARLKSRGDLSVADSWIAATAIMRGAVLLHRDPEFRRIPELRDRFPEG